MMASAAPLEDIDEQFLQCCICLDRLKEPKILQCLHRYCRDCLKTITKEGDKKVQCPTCRDEHTLPEGGIDGLKTDFNTKNIVEFIQLQESVEQDPLKECAGCDKRLRVSAYCFRCNDFLCQGCHEYHKASKIVKDHRNHVFSLSDAGAKNLTIEKLASLKDAPRCHNHPEKLSELVCTSCGNLPICVPCTFGAHRGHVLQEVSSLAKVEREQLVAKMADLEQYKGKILKRQEEIRRAQYKLRQTVDQKRRHMQEKLRIEEETIEREVRETEERLEKKAAELEEETMRKKAMRKQELEKELTEARARYEKFCEEERQEADAGFEVLQEESNREKMELQERLDKMNKGIEVQLASLETKKEGIAKKIKDLADHYDGIMERIKTVTMTTSSILEAKHDWTDVQCIPDVCRAIDPLMQEVQREYPELIDLAKVNMSRLILGKRDKVNISEKPESVVEIVCLQRVWRTKGITSNLDGNIIITGGAGNGSHVTVINSEGEQQGQCILSGKWGSSSGRCDSLSNHMVLVVFDSMEMGVYNITDNVYTGRDIGDLVTWPWGQWISSVVVDHDKNHILVGCTRREIYVFNDELCHIKTLTLPEKCKRVVDLTVHEGDLVIINEQAAYAFTMDQQCRMMYEFPNSGRGWHPQAVCTDSNHFIYILWVNGRRSEVVQYSPIGRQLLAKRSLDEGLDVRCIATVDTYGGEKLIMATFDTGKLITYGLD